MYIYLGKGIAYGFFAEALLILGVILIFRYRKNFEILWDKQMQLLVVFILLTFFFILRGFSAYNPLDVIRDSFLFNYAFFAFIVFLFKDDISYFKEGVLQIYKYYPLVQCVLLLLSFIPFMEELELFPGRHLLYFKYGDMAVHLFVVTIFSLSGWIKYKPRYEIINYILIAYLYMIASSYNRGGMVGFLFCFVIFYFCLKDQSLKQKMSGYLKWFPIILLAALPFFAITQMEENFQGRKAGFDQLKDNITSVVTSNGDGSLEDNKVWRLVWWTKIIDYTFGGQYFFQGKGLGPALASADEIVLDDTEDELRSPHNFNLTILARFGVPVFLLWLYWLYLLIRDLFRKNTTQLSFVYLIVICMFLFNASFDVFLEGPMGALPFWTIIGLRYMENTFAVSGEQAVQNKTISA
jgi:hypothetical protein